MGSSTRNLAAHWYLGRRGKNGKEGGVQSEKKRELEGLCCKDPEKAHQPTKPKS